jgi:hypothetical protein
MRANHKERRLLFHIKANLPKQLGNKRDKPKSKRGKKEYFKK